MGVVVDALKSLWARGRLRGDDELVAGIGDVIEAGPKALGRAVIDESWPGTAVTTLPTWHGTLGVAYDPTLPVADQQTRLQAMMTALGGVSIPALQSQVNKEFPNVVVSEVEITARRGLSRYGASRYGVTTSGVISSVSYRLSGTVPNFESVKRLTAILRRYGPAHMLATSELTYENDNVENRYGLARRGASRCVGSVTPSAPAFPLSPFIAGIAEPGATLYVYTVGVSGVPTPTLTYQWKLGGSDIEGGTSDRLDVLTAGSYTCEVTATNSAGTVTEETDPASTPVLAPIIYSAIAYPMGSMLLLDIVSAGRPEPSVGYQWSRDGVDISGQTGASIDLTGRASGSYQCYITATNSEGSTSLLSGAYVASVPFISSTSLSISGDVLSAGAAFSGAPSATLSYQWRKDGGDIVGQTGASLSLVGRSPGAYACYITATNPIGAASSLTSSYAATAPGITWAGTISAVKPPFSAFYTLSPTGLSVSSSLAATVSYQWYRNGSPYSTSSTTTAFPLVGDAYYLTVTATNAVGTATQTSNTHTF